MCCNMVWQSWLVASHATPSWSQRDPTNVHHPSPFSFHSSLLSAISLSSALAKSWSMARVLEGIPQQGSEGGILQHTAAGTQKFDNHSPQCAHPLVRLSSTTRTPRAMILLRFCTECDRAHAYIETHTQKLYGKLYICVLQYIIDLFSVHLIFKSGLNVSCRARNISLSAGSPCTALHL